jgi:hypothetical protein
LGKSAKKQETPDLFEAAGEGRGNARRASGNGRAAPRGAGSAGDSGYTAKHIEVLEGSSRCAAGPACISAAPTRRRCITCSPR